MFSSLGFQRVGNRFANFWEGLYEASVEICKANKDLYLRYRLWGSLIEDTFHFLFAHSDAVFSHDVS